jgi:hypothetical protein
MCKFDDLFLLILIISKTLFIKKDLVDFFWRFIVDLWYYWEADFLSDNFIFFTFSQNHDKCCCCLGEKWNLKFKQNIFFINKKILLVFCLFTFDLFSNDP